MKEQNNSIPENLQIVEENIAKACRKAGRNREDVCLIAVSKTKPVEMLKEAYDFGCRDFGENKVQEIMDKYELLPKDIRWHMIGHLQTNKVKYIIDKVALIHSVDSIKLAKEISKEAVKRELTVKILLEVNMAKEESKFGVLPEECISFYNQVSLLPNLCICGLMTIAPYVVNPEENRQHFVNLHQLEVDIVREKKDNSTISELSMGMTGDYCVAVEEGSTFVRVGTGIFGERFYKI